MLQPTPETVLPLLMIMGVAMIFFGMAIKTLITDKRSYDDAKALTGSPKRAVLGLVSPEVPAELDIDVERGFALSYVNSEVVIIPNGRLPAENL